MLKQYRLMIDETGSPSPTQEDRDVCGVRREQEPPEQVILAWLNRFGSIAFHHVLHPELIADLHDRGLIYPGRLPGSAIDCLYWLPVMTFGDDLVGKTRFEEAAETDFDLEDGACEDCGAGFSRHLHGKSLFCEDCKARKMNDRQVARRKRLRDSR